MKLSTYKIMIICLMIVFPIVSGLIELANTAYNPAILVFGKWFVFWGIGVRLLIAGIRQIAKPNLTSEEILGIKGSEAWVLVRELGFANLGLGLIGVLSLWLTGWGYAAGLAGGLFLTLAGIGHLKKQQRNSDENLAMVTDLLVGIIGLLYFLSFVVIYIALFKLS